MKARVPVGIDLPAVEGRYHRKCFQSFFKDREKPRFDKTSTPISKRGRNVYELKSNTLNAVILELEGSNDGVKSMNDIAKTLEETVEIYSTRHIQRKLREHFGKNGVKFVGKMPHINRIMKNTIC